MGDRHRPVRPRERRATAARGHRERYVLAVRSPGRMTGGMRTRARLGLVALALVLGLSACDETGETDGGSAGFPPIVLSPDEQAGYDALILDLLGTDGLSGRLASYWPDAYAATAIGALYRPPADVTAYEGAAQESACGPLS